MGAVYVVSHAYAGSILRQVYSYFLNNTAYAAKLHGGGWLALITLVVPLEFMQCHDDDDDGDGDDDDDDDDDDDEFQRHY